MPIPDLPILVEQGGRKQGRDGNRDAASGTETGTQLVLTAATAP